ncbi:MAG: alpha/beta hydrolase [Bacteroidetes bacterium]|nr:alpha/beta hydrolase [Bacteroidota bacterium]
MSKKYSIVVMLSAMLVVFPGCDVLKTLSTVQQVQQGKVSIVKGDDNLPGAQKGGISLNNEPFKENHKPGGTKYKDPIYTNIKKTSETYATNVKQFNGVAKNLVMDLYTPVDNREMKKPVVIYLFGGGWFMKQIGGMDQFGKSFAMKGYLGVTIDYRIGFQNASGMLTCKTEFSGFDEAVYRAAQDAKAAIRYLKANADRLGIDKNKIFIGGHSAGAFTSLNAVQLDDRDVPQSIRAKLGDVNSVGGHQNESTTVAGNFVLAGGTTHTLDYIDKKVPTYIMQGTCDDILPDGYGKVYHCQQAVYPSVYTGAPLYNKYKSIGACVHYDVSCGGDHEFGNLGWFMQAALVGEFVYNILGGSCKTNKRGIPAPTKGCPKTDASVCN